jgi:hypothetical protein
MFSRDVTGIIADYASEHKLLPWIDENDLYWSELSDNSNAIDLLKANPEKINWLKLSHNTNAIDLLKANPDKINWLKLSKNPNAIDLLKANPEKIDWLWRSSNPSIFEPSRDMILMRLV